MSSIYYFFSAILAVQVYEASGYERVLNYNKCYTRIHDTSHPLIVDENNPETLKWIGGILTPYCQVAYKGGRGNDQTTDEEYKVCATSTGLSLSDCMIQLMIGTGTENEILKVVNCSDRSFEVCTKRGQLLVLTVTNASHMTGINNFAVQITGIKDESPEDNTTIIIIAIVVPVVVVIVCVVCLCHVCSKRRSQN